MSVNTDEDFSSFKTTGYPLSELFEIFLSIGISPSNSKSSLLDKSLPPSSPNIKCLWPSSEMK